MKRIVLVTTMLFALSCGEGEREQSARQMSGGGDPQLGRVAIAKYGCGSCHMIPGVSASSGRTGPPLNGIADRLYLAGRIQHTPENLMLWIQHPKAVDPKTVMPEMGISDVEARNIAAFLYAQR